MNCRKEKHMAKKATKYYAIQHTYGASTGDSRKGREGNHIGTCYAFPNAAERDAWVNESTVGIRSQSGYREAMITRGSRADRVAIREAVDWYTGAPVVEGGR